MGTFATWESTLAWKAMDAKTHRKWWNIVLIGLLVVTFARAAILMGPRDLYLIFRGRYIE